MPSPLEGVRRLFARGKASSREVIPAGGKAKGEEKGDENVFARQDVSFKIPKGQAAPELKDPSVVDMSSSSELNSPQSPLASVICQTNGQRQLGGGNANGGGRPKPSLKLPPMSSTSTASSSTDKNDKYEKNGRPPHNVSPGRRKQFFNFLMGRKEPLLPPPGESESGKKCLVLDLDETLVHSSFRPTPGSDYIIPITIDNMTYDVYVKKRPGVDDFLRDLAQLFELVIYTASLSKYADPLLDRLDPQRNISHRLYREHCAFYQGTYVKDLSRLNRDLSQLIFIDDSPASFQFQPQNAIHITKFIDDLKDTELFRISSFLKGCHDSGDIREDLALFDGQANAPLHESPLGR